MKPRKRSTIIKAAGVLAVIVGVALLYRLLPISVWLTTFRGWVGGLGPAGYVVYALVYAACVVLFVPPSILTLGAGLPFGVSKGPVVVAIGASLGSPMAFLLARPVLPHPVAAL